MPGRCAGALPTASNSSSIRSMVASGPYLYGLTTGGGLKRYTVTKDYGVVGAGTIATTGWSRVRSLAYGGWWDLGKGKAAEDLVGLTSTGAVKAYLVPRDNPRAVKGRTLVSGGWGMFGHLAVGECATGQSRTLAGVKPNGEVFAYLDVDANDQKGNDIRGAGRVATGWTGLVAD